MDGRRIVEHRRHAARCHRRGTIRHWYATFARYVDEHVIDHEGGSWFHQLDGDNRVIGTVWPGKSDLYHAFQSTLIPFLDPAVSIATAVKNAA